MALWTVSCRTGLHTFPYDYHSGRSVSCWNLGADRKLLFSQKFQRGNITCLAFCSMLYGDSSLGFTLEKMITRLSMPSSAGFERMRRNWLSWFSVCYCFPPIHIVFSNPKLLWNWPSEYRLRVAVCSRKEGRRLGETKILLSQLMSKEIMEKSKRRAFTLPHVV